MEGFNELGYTTDPNNPFSDAFHKAEVENFLRYATTNAVQVGSATYGIATVRAAILEDYFNKYWVVDAKVPLFMRNNETWMSITRMEIQSMWCPIQKAHGRVGTSGLGLGYFAIKAASKPSVTSVDVWEIAPEVIELFDKVHVNLPAEIRAKIHIHNQSIYDMRDQKFDFFFADHYLDAGGAEMLTDVEPITMQNKIRQYALWTQERYMLELVLNQRIRISSVDMVTRILFDFWARSGLDKLHGESPDATYLENFLRLYNKKLRYY
jgi:hypothetical protein